MHSASILQLDKEFRSSLKIKGGYHVLADHSVLSYSSLLLGQMKLTEKYILHACNIHFTENHHYLQLFYLLI